MILELFIKGLMIGLLFGVPAGAIGALTIQRVLEGGFLYGFITGMGSSAADVIYAICGVFGITLITGFLQRNEILCSICGSILIIIYGTIIIMKKNDPDGKKLVSNKTYISGFLTSFFVALMNPTTIISFIVAFSTFGLIEDYNFSQGTAIVLGVLVGTGIWWCSLSFIVNRLRDKITDRIYIIMNLILGTILILFGIGMIIRCLAK